MGMSSLRLFLISTLLRKEKQTMAVVYVTLVVKGLKTLAEVPSLIRAEVASMLEALEVTV